MIDDKQREAMEAEAKRILGGYWYQEEGALALAEWMHAHDAEKLAMAEWVIQEHGYEARHSNAGSPVAQAVSRSYRIIAEAKEDTDGSLS